MPLLGFFVFIVVLFVFNFHLLFHPVETSWKEQFYLELARVPFGSFCRFLSSLLSFYLVMESGVEVSWITAAIVSVSPVTEQLIGGARWRQAHLYTAICK